MLPEEVLVCRIFEQAIEDYTELTQKNIQVRKDNSSYYSIQDIEHFLNSKWSTELLNAINSELTGKDILQKIKLHYVA